MLGDITLREQILDRLRGEGLVLADDPGALARLEEMAQEAQSALPGNVLDDLGALFVFREDDQPEELQGFDGWLWSFGGLGKTRHALGVAVSVVEGPKNYAFLVLLHEIAHLLSDQGHNACFSNCLDVLIKRFNQATGSNITNDYACIMRPSTVGRMDGAKVPRIGQKRRGWPLGKL